MSDTRTHTKTTKTGRSAVQLDPTSCSKIFSHVFKHPHSDVSGLLLTSSSSSVEDDDKDAKTNDDDVTIIKVSDAIPLFHRESIDCAAMNEIALAHAHTYATSKNARICGLYFANGGNFIMSEEEEKLLLPDRAKGLADAIAHNTHEDEDEAHCVYVLFVDAGKLKAFVEESSSSSSTTLLPFRVFSRESNNENNNKSGGGSELKARSDIPARVCVPDADERQRRRFDRDVADFDDHFDDVSKDWRNTTTTTT